MFTWRRKFWMTRLYQGMKTSGPSPKNFALSEKVRTNTTERFRLKTRTGLSSSFLFFLDFDDISNRVDFIICLGGDGTLLYASSLFQVFRFESSFWGIFTFAAAANQSSFVCFQESVPPVMAFHLGSLGFLTPFKFDTYQSQVTQIIEGTRRSLNCLSA